MNEEEEEKDLQMFMKFVPEMTDIKRKLQLDDDKFAKFLIKSVFLFFPARLSEKQVAEGIKELNGILAHIKYQRKCRKEN